MGKRNARKSLRKRRHTEWLANYSSMVSGMVSGAFLASVDENLNSIYNTVFIDNIFANRTDWKPKIIIR